MTMVPTEEIDARLAAYAGGDVDVVALRFDLLAARNQVGNLRDEVLSLRQRLARVHTEAENKANELEERLDTAARKLSEARGLMFPIAFATSAFWIGILAGWRWIG